MIHRGIFLLLIPFCVLLPASSYCQPLFSPATVEIPLRGIQSTTIADFNHDGCNDIAILNEDPNTADILLYLMQPTGWYTINEELEDIEGNSISVGDFNGDNNIDLLVNDPTGYLHILLGYGNGTFEDPISIDVGDLGISTPPRFGAIGHLNDDDFADIVCGDSAKTLILLGHGNGYFYTASCFPIGGFFEGYAVLGDLDEDGSTDIILPKYRLSPDDPSDSMTVLLNDGSGTFSQDSIYNVGIIVEPWTGTYSDIDVSDFDGDGVLDVVCAPSAYTYGPYQPAIKFLKGNGDGTFGDLIESETGDELTAIHPVYFNQDGFLDLVVLPPWYLYGNEIGLMLGSGDGSFETLHWHPILSYLYIEKLDDFLTGDFNDDGYQDILIQRRGIWETGGLDILFGDGDTTFQIAPQYEVGINPNSVVSADFNSDHHQDLATANTVGKTITILLNDGSGNFSGEPIEIDVLGDPFIIKTTDLDSDGNIDLIASDTLNTRLIMLLGDGASGFGTFNYYPLTDNPYDLVIGDFNEDNNPDVAVSLNFDKVLVLFGNGLGSFIGVTQLDFSSRLTAITSADFNGDGHLDLATRELTRFSINFGDGSGEFGQRRDYNTDYPSSVVWDKIETSDFNHDGNQDIIVLSWLVGEIWLGDGEGGMIYHTSVNAQSSLNVGLALKDFNGDANIDIAMGGEVVTLLLGDGAGNFNPGQYNYIATPIMHFSMVCLNSLCSGDFNGDGNSDLAVIHPDSNKLAILFGTEGLTHDIGVLTILSPIGEIPSGSEVSPTAELMNLGAETETFQVYFQIGPVYDDTVEVTLGVGERDAITFSPWMPFETGTYNTNCGVIFPADENPHNNLVTGSVTVIDTSSSEEIFIASIWPNSGGDIGWITMTITGLNFEDTVDVRLIKEGQPDIVGGSYQTENTEVISPTKIRAVFNLDGVARGNWDVLVTNRGGGADTLVNGFTVKTGVLHLWVDISGLTTFSFRGVDIPLTYRISAGNNGNVNLDRVILRADVPNYLKITSIVNTANNDTIAYGDSLETLDIYDD